MDPFALRRLGSTDIHLPHLGFGGVGVGNLFTAVGNADADATVTAAWEIGIR